MMNESVGPQKFQMNETLEEKVTEGWTSFEKFRMGEVTVVNRYFVQQRIVPKKQVEGAMLEN